MNGPESSWPSRRALPPGDDAAALVGAGRSRIFAAPDPTRIYAVTAPNEVTLVDYWRIILRHRWQVIAFLFVTVAATAAWTFTTRPIFTATATLRLEKEEPRVVKFEDVVKAETGTQDYYLTQYQILQSRSLANSVIARLRLDQHPEFQEGDRGWYDAVRKWVNRLTPKPPEVEPAAREELGVISPLTDGFLGQLTVEPIRSSRLVKIAFESHHPDLAARVVNTLADTFITQQLQQKADATLYATDFLTKQLDEAGRKLRDAETELNKFLKANNVFFLSGEKTGEQQDLITHQLSQLSEALLKARSDRIMKESLYAQTVGRGAESLPAVLGSTLVARLKEELAKSEAEYRKLGQTFKPEYPRMEQLERSIAELRRQLGHEVRQILDGLEADYHAALLTERGLQKSVDNHQQLVRKLGDGMPQYSVLRRDVDTNRQVYISLLTRLKETQVSSALITSNISLVDRGEIPLHPSKPRKTLNLLLAVIVGLFGGVGLAFLMEYLDKTVKNANDIQSVLRVPALGVVPRVALRGQHLVSGHGLAAHALHGAPPALAARSEAERVFAEAFRTLRTALLYRSSDRCPKTLMVTSPRRGEGKTTIASNLAIALSQRNAGAVLLVDADLRRPRLHEAFDIRSTPGLSNFLAGQAELPEVIKPTDSPNLYILPAGLGALSLADLLASPRLAPLLGALGEHFTHTVFDTTPLFGVSDALSLAPHVGGVVLVLRHGHTDWEGARRAVQLLGAFPTPLLGVVLNHLNPRVARDGYGYYDYPQYPNPGDLDSRHTNADDWRRA